MRTIRINVLKDIGLKSSLGILSLAILNYIFYFKPYNLAYLSISSILVLFFLAVLFSLDKETYLKFLLLLIIVYPKKAISYEWAGEGAKDLLILMDLPVISLLEFGILPAVSLIGLKHIRHYRMRLMANRNKNAFWAVLFCVGYILGTVNYVINVRLFDQISIMPGSAYFVFFSGFQVLLIVQACLIDFDPNRMKPYFEKLCIFFLVILFLEYLIDANGFFSSIISSQVTDYRGGFRSLFLGYGVLVGFYCFLSYCVAILLYFRTGKSYYFVLSILAMFLQFSSMDRAPIVASLLFTTLVCFSNRKFPVLMWISVVCLIIFFVEFGFGWLLKLPIAVVKEGRLFSIGSLVERFALQMRGLDIATYFNFLGSGYNSYWWTCISNIPSYFSPIGNIKLTMLYENVLLGLKQSDPHNLYIAILVEGGLLSFVGFLVLLYRYGKTQVLNTLVYHSNKPNLHVEGGPFLLAMLSYYMVQVQPNYYFFPIFILRFYGYQKNTSR